MNEIELIRKHLATERARAVGVANAGARALERAGASAPGEAATLDAFVGACGDYLGVALGAFAERDRRLTDLCARLSGESPERRALEELLAAPGASAAALERLATASAAPRSGWPELARYVSGAWSRRRLGIEALLAASYRTRDWRTVGALDADGVLGERARFAQLCSLAPPGIELAPRDARPQELAR